MRAKPPKSPGRPRKVPYEQVLERWKHRLRDGLSMSSLARELGISRRTVKGIVSGEYLRKSEVREKGLIVYPASLADQEQVLKSNLIIEWT